MTRTTLLLSLLAVTTLACQQPAGDEASAPQSEPTAAASEPAVNSAVEYEPAYPTDVSSEALSEDDLAQQEASQPHDDADAHPHDDEGHDHGEDGGDDGHEH